MHPLPDVSKYTEPPVEFVGDAEGIAIRSTTLEKAGDCVGQHSHPYSHATLVGNGAVRVWVNDLWRGDFRRGDPIGIKAGCSHIFQALEDDTFMSCLTVISKVEGV